MGIESLNSAILYSVSLYFHLHRTNIPDPGHKKGLFSGRRSHFAIRGQKNGRFSGQEKKKTLKEMLKFLSYRSSRRFAPQDDKGGGLRSSR